MRLQPPRNENDFIGKEVNKEIITSYIGSHRLILKSGETTVREYLEDEKWITIKDIPSFLTMFPYEIQDLAEIYLEDVLRHRPVPKHNLL